MTFSWVLATLVATRLTSTMAVDRHDLDMSNRYVVTLKPDADVAKHLNMVRQLHTAANSQREFGKRFEGISHHYNISDFQGYAGHFDSGLIEHLKNHDAVEDVEPDQIWTAAGGMIAQANAPYGLSLISHKDLPRKAPEPDDGSYIYDESAGDGTYAYIIDSGINMQNVEFDRRARKGYNAVKRDVAAWTDESGHGTHIAAIIGGKTYGVTKRSTLIAVKVLRTEQGVMSQILDGYQWAANDITTKRRAAVAVIDVAVYGPYSTAFNRAVDAASAKGVTTVACAGNDNKNVAMSPASARTAISVSATDANRERATFANWGDHVDIWAPGVRIISANKGSRTAVGKGSGTAQASAFVAGLVLYFKKLKALPDARATKAFLLRQAIPGVVTVPSGPKGAFAYNGSGK
ncbi:hypothetical protein ANO11243_071640 [Dothideomycetidae sp. 11243]|nr:hypothetical protein ANO11243_071640 [fungal sp. No.11243]